MSAPQFLPWQLRDPPATGWATASASPTRGWCMAWPASASWTSPWRPPPACFCETPQDGLACGHCAACLVRQRQPSRPAPHSSRSHRGGRGRRGRRTGRGRRARGRQRIQARAVQKSTSTRSAHWNPGSNTATHRGGWRVALLYPAHALKRGLGQRAAQGAGRAAAARVFCWWRTRPPAVADPGVALPPPALPAPDADTALQWLRARTSNPPANGWRPAARAWRLRAERRGRLSPWLGQLVAPLAQGQSPDVGTLAEALEKVPATDWIDALQRFYTDLMRPPRCAGALLPHAGREAWRSGARPAGPRGRAARWLTRQRAATRMPSFSPTPRSSAWCYPAWRSRAAASPAASRARRRPGSGRRPQPGFPCTSIPTAI